MGGRGSHSSSFSAPKRPATLESLGLKQSNEFNALPDETKESVLDAIDRVYSELPQMKGEISFVDYYERPKRKIKASTAGQAAYVKPLGDNSKLVLLEKFKNTDRLNKQLSTGMNATSSTDAKGVLYHEIGHAVVARISKKTGNPNVQNDIAAKATAAVGTSNPISKYSRTSSHEFIAEAVSDYMTRGSKANPLSVNVWKQLKNYLS